MGGLRLFSLDKYGLSGCGYDIKSGLIVDGVLTALAASRVSERLSQNRYVQAFSRAMQSLPLAVCVTLGALSITRGSSGLGLTCGAACIAQPVALAAARHWMQSKGFKELDFCLAIAEKITSVAAKTISLIGFTLLTLLVCQPGVPLITTAFYLSLMTVQIACLVKATIDVVHPLFSSIDPRLLDRGGLPVEKVSSK